MSLGRVVALYDVHGNLPALEAVLAEVEELDPDGLGDVLFCHGSPRSDEERITSVTPDERLGPMLDGVEEATVVCGHTHHQFDRLVDRHRVVNAGSVGMPYEGDAAAFWATLGPEIELRRTAYDIEAALHAMRATGLPDVDELLKESLIEPADPELVAEFFEGRATGAEPPPPAT